MVLNVLKVNYYVEIQLPNTLFLFTTTNKIILKLQTFKETS